MSGRFPLEITWGVEVECVIKFPEKDFPEAKTKVFHDEIRDLLMNADIPTYTEEEDFSYITKYEKWTVKTDSTITEVEEDGSQDDDFWYQNTEIISRILNVNEEAFEEVTRALAAILGKYPMVVNSSTGLHVHLGSKGDDIFPFETLKNLSIFVTGFEHVIESLHSNERVGSVDKLNWCKPPSAMEGLKNLNGTLARVFKLGHAEDSKDVLDVLNNPSRDRFTATNMTNLGDFLPNVRQHYGKIAKGTIEFRQHTGSVDAEEICSWAKFVIGILDFCHDTSDADFANLVIDHCEDLNFSALMLLRRIGKGELCTFYSTRLKIRNREPSKYSSQFQASVW